MPNRLTETVSIWNDWRSCGGGGQLPTVAFTGRNTSGEKVEGDGEGQKSQSDQHVRPFNAFIDRSAI